MVSRNMLSQASKSMTTVLGPDREHEPSDAYGENEALEYEGPHEAEVIPD